MCGGYYEANQKKQIKKSFSPPKSRKNLKLCDHLVTTLNMLITRYPAAPIILGADKNEMDIKPLLTCGLRLKQIVDVGTRKGKILDVILMNIPQMYNSPIIVPPVPCDNPSDGVPSDHWVPVCYPHTNRYQAPLRRFREVSYRPLPAEGVREFGKWITSESFNQITSISNGGTHPSSQAQLLQNILLTKLDETCPVKTMKIGPQDKPFINLELKKLNRRKQREWIRKGKSDKYKKLAAKFKKEYRSAAERYIRNKVDDLKEAQPGKAFRILKSMGAQPGDCCDGGTFSLPNHLELNLTDQECSEKIASHFFSISMEFTPLCKDRLPDRVRTRLEDKSNPPIITEYECYKKVKVTKKPNSVIPGDLPSALIKEFTVELANPLSSIYNNIIQSASWPQQWKVEYITPISKVPVPLSEDDLRPIALTSFFSKVLEQFVVAWLLEHIGNKMDFRQYGGIKGNSICHYLMEFLNFILYHQDSPEPTAVLACLIDFSKAFNRQDHHILITKLSDMGVPGWLLRIVMSFLTNRFMRVKYKGKLSDFYPLPGGGPQGALLGLFLFLVLINDVGFSGQENNTGDLITCKRRVLEMNTLHLKFVDDLSIAESINLKKQLTPTPVEEQSLPAPFRARTGHKFNSGESLVFDQLIKTKEYADKNKMMINFKKTKLMVFNPSRNHDFLPDFAVQGQQIELVEETKLLGLVITSDLSWSRNTDYMVGRCNSKMWVIRRLKNLGASENDLMDVYCKQIRSILEFAVPVWNSALNGEQILQIERIQKTALHIILDKNYLSYRNALKISGLEKLSTRRTKLCLNFAKKAQKSTKFAKWFIPTTKVNHTRFEPPKFCPAYSRTKRFENSPISYLIEILNKHYAKRK